jgi:hypothetical protein
MLPTVNSTLHFNGISQMTVFSEPSSSLTEKCELVTVYVFMFAEFMFIFYLNFFYNICGNQS